MALWDYCSETVNGQPVKDQKIEAALQLPTHGAASLTRLMRPTTTFEVTTFLKENEGNALGKYMRQISKIKYIWPRDIISLVHSLFKGSGKNKPTCYIIRKSSWIIDWRTGGRLRSSHRDAQCPWRVAKSSIILRFWCIQDFNVSANSRRRR